MKTAEGSERFPAISRFRCVRGRALALALACLSLSSTSALAGGPTSWGEPSCRGVTAFPANLNSPGVYCLSYKYIDFGMTTGTLITISADNVVFDLNGATLDGTTTQRPTSTNPSYGIRAYNHSNITIRNGTVKGFGYGISLTAPLGYVGPTRKSHNFVIENMQVVNSNTIGIEVLGNDSTIRSNFVAHTGGSQVSGGDVMGIRAGGNSVRIIDNDVSYTVPHIKQPGATHGISLAGGRDFIIVNNRISEAPFGIYGGNINWGIYRDNITVNVATPYTGGTDIGNNN